MAHQIDALSIGDLAQASALCWRVFEEFEAPDYCDEGVREFRQFVQPAFLEGQCGKGMRLWGCRKDGALAGVIAVRPPAHISLLFVDKAFHRQGIARALWETAREDYRKHSEATVNASPYALEAYRRLGFAESAAEQVVNGLRFIPMVSPL